MAIAEVQEKEWKYGLFQASTWIMIDNIPLVKASHLAGSRISVGARYKGHTAKDVDTQGVKHWGHNIISLLQLYHWD